MEESPDQVSQTHGLRAKISLCEYLQNLAGTQDQPELSQSIYAHIASSDRKKCLKTSVTMPGPASISSFTLSPKGWSWECKPKTELLSEQVNKCVSRCWGPGAILLPSPCRLTLNIHSVKGVGLGRRALTSNHRRRKLEKFSGCTLRQRQGEWFVQNHTTH